MRFWLCSDDKFLDVVLPNTSCFNNNCSINALIVNDTGLLCATEDLLHRLPDRWFGPVPHNNIFPRDVIVWQHWTGIHFPSFTQCQILLKHSFAILLKLIVSWLFFQREVSSSVDCRKLVSVFKWFFQITISEKKRNLKNEVVLNWFKNVVIEQLTALLKICLIFNLHRKTAEYLNER